MRSGCSQPVGGHRRPGRAHRMCRRAGRRDLVARRQRRPAILGATRGIPADVRRHTAVAAEDGEATPPAQRPQRTWLRTGDLGVYLDGELYVTGRRADMLLVDGRHHYPQDIEATAAAASPMVRRGYVAAFSTDDGRGDHRRTRVGHPPRRSGTGASTPSAQRWLTCTGLSLSDVRFVPAGAIPRTTSGKLARHACRAEYLRGEIG